MGSDTRIYQLHVTLSRIYDKGEKIGKGGKEDSDTTKREDSNVSLIIVKNDHELQIKTVRGRRIRVNLEGNSKVERLIFLLSIQTKDA